MSASRKMDLSGLASKPSKTRTKKEVSPPMARKKKKRSPTPEPSIPASSVLSAELMEAVGNLLVLCAGGKCHHAIKILKELKAVQPDEIRSDWITWCLLELIFQLWPARIDDVGSEPCKKLEVVIFHLALSEQSRMGYDRHLMRVLAKSEQAQHIAPPFSALKATCRSGAGLQEKAGAVSEFLHYSDGVLMAENLTDKGAGWNYE